jgi:hypothetical protein
VRDGVERLESHWVRLPEMGTLRDTVVDVLELLGGVASAPHCAAGLLDLVGSTVDEPLRSRLAEALAALPWTPNSQTRATTPILASCTAGRRAASSSLRGQPCLEGGHQ